MSDVVHLIRSQALLLAPFVNFVVVYFAFVRDPIGDIWTTLMKCAPICSLMLYVLLKGCIFTREYSISKCILFGLLFSCAGDVLLNIDLLPHGMAAFGVAHIFYISAFGWKPLKLFIGIPLYCMGIALYVVLIRHLDEILTIGVPVYTGVLLTMCWRALAQADHKHDFLSIFCGVGSVLFVISDGLIALNMFLTEIPHARVFIMTTYYAAQLAIAFSSAPENELSMKWDQKRN